MIRSSVTISLVPEARGGPFVFWDDHHAACRFARIGARKKPRHVFQRGGAIFDSASNLTKARERDMITFVSSQEETRSSLERR